MIFVIFIQANNNIDDLVMWENNEIGELFVRANSEEVRRQAALTTSDLEGA
jgi:hypothetical protein